MKAQTDMNRYLLRPATIPLRRARSIRLSRHSIVPVVESPGSVYLAGLGLGIGCGALVLVFLLGALNL
jgi:hypothetical protein